MNGRRDAARDEARDEARGETRDDSGHAAAEDRFADRLGEYRSASPAPGRRDLSPLARRVVISAMAGAAGALAASLLRGYPLDLSLVTGVAVGLLAFATLRTLDRMRGLRRR